VQCGPHNVIRQDLTMFLFGSHYLEWLKNDSQGTIFAFNASEEASFMGTE
jgi:hypothetical protein